MTLLELNQAPHGKRVANCLPTGEFISATAESAQCFSHSPDLSAQDLYGRNLCQFLAPQDIEKLEEFMRGHCTNKGTATQATTTFMAQNASGGLRMMVRVQDTGSPIWIRLVTIPLTLRMSRCIDAVQSMYNPVHLFADSSSFVVSEEDLTRTLPSTSQQQHQQQRVSNSVTSNSAGSSLASPSSLDVYIPEGDEEALWSDKRSFVDNTMLPLELKDSPRTIRHGRGDRRHGKRTASSVSTELADDEELIASDEDDDVDESLADYAFEADWAGEVAHESQKRSPADPAHRAAPVN